MIILVVKTCDGDVYFSNRNASKIKASDMAADQVLVGNVVAWCQEDQAAVRACVDNRDYGKLYKTLLEIGAIREAQVNE